MWGPILALAASAWVEAEHAKARLVANDAIAPGGSASVALEIVAEEGWHTYWLNPGDAGMATRVEWTLPKGWSASELAWPAPIRFDTDGVTSFGYEGRVVLPATVTAPARAKGKAKIRARASWLVCREVCLPGDAELTLTLPVRTGAAKSDLAKIPPLADWPAEIGKNGNPGFTLRVGAPEGVVLEGAYFFPETPGIVDPSAAQTLTKVEGGGYSILLPRAANASLDGVSEIRGVIVSGENAWRLNVKVNR